jgi:molecular chaperone HscA
LTSNDYLQEELWDGGQLSRYQLLVGLLSIVIFSIRSGLGLEIEDLETYDIRISHPVWSDGEWVANKSLVERVLCEAISLSYSIEQGISVGKFLDLFEVVDSTFAIKGVVDILEPVAAVLDLFRESNNSRQVCAIVDIGAGTTDIGLFLALTPDANVMDFNDQHFLRKFVRLANPISLSYAGDYIDKALLELYTVKVSKTINTHSRLYKTNLEFYKHQIRDLKLELFESGEAIFGDIAISREELEETPAIKLMQQEIASAFSKMIIEASDQLLSLYDLRVNYIREINLIFAGGGYKLSCIRSSISKFVPLTDEFAIPINITELLDDPRSYVAMMRARLAVCRGGVAPASHWPNTNREAKIVGSLDFSHWKHW